jgi:DNA-binding transcriptional regulator YiaG
MVQDWLQEQGRAPPQAEARRLLSRVQFADIL